MNDNSMKWSMALIAGLLVVLAQSAGMAGAPTRSSESLTLVDLDGAKITLSAEDLRKMPLDVEEQCICVGESAGFIGIFDYTGVRMTELLHKAKAAQAASGYKKENMYLVFKGTDGYQVVASWCEITGTPDGKRALVVIEKDAKPLPPSEGKFRLAFPADKYVGRSVKCLESIEIHCADGVVERKKESKEPGK